MDTVLLNKLHTIDDLKRMDETDLPMLCEEIRAFILENVAQTGGHLASSLGAVELIVAIHRVFDSPKDKIVFDVGHQAYAHKILTGRKDAFHTLRTENGISGFPKREESEHDVFNTGHSSTSISAALGYARAMKLTGSDGVAVALIGDGAMTGGLAYEAMDDAGNDKLPLVIVLNDNEMSISKNVGGLTMSLAKLRSGKGYLAFKRGIVRRLDGTPGGKRLSVRMERFKNRIKHFLLPEQLFEQLGMTYFGPINGHDVRLLIQYLKRMKEMQRPVILHTITRKGQGYACAQENPERFHGVSPFSVETGQANECKQRTCSEVFGQTLTELAAKNERIVAITAAMPSGTGLSRFADTYPDRFFDVGIAEEHAVTMAAGLAAGGMRPVVAVYSSFLQRAYDQLLHDVCLQNLPVVLAVDRAGLVGEDGETHQGVYDPAYLSTMPNLAVYAPATMRELKEMLALAVSRREPAVIRYNRGTLPEDNPGEPVIFGKWEIVRPIRPVTILAAGTLLPTARRVAEANDAGLINMRFLQPMDETVLETFRKAHTRLLVLEENIAAVAPQIALACNPCIVKSCAVPNRPVAQGTVLQQRKRLGLDEESVAKALLSLKTMGGETL